MNTCTFEVPIPDWVNWIAQDEDCRWHGYENEPQQLIGEWGDNRGKWIELVKGTHPKNWKQELYRFE